MTAHPIVLVIVFAYLAFMLALGYWVSRERIKDNDDFIVAGRRLSWFLLAATLAATEVGGGSSMGVVKKAFGAWGLGAAWYIWTMALTFMVLGLAAPRLSRTGCKTIPEYFRKRYGPTASLLTSVLMIVALCGLTAVQMVVTALILSIMTGLPYPLAATISGVVVTVYTCMGGMWSVTLTDFVQWFFIVGGMALAIPFALNHAGGTSAVTDSLPAEATGLISSIGIGEILSLTVIYVASFMVGQETLQRLYSARSETDARRGALATSGFYLLFGFIPPILGLIALSMVKRGILPVEPLAKLGDNAILPLMAVHSLPPVLTGLLFAGLISATMSSADSNLLGASAIWTNDLAPRFRRSDTRADSPVGSVAGSRWAVAVIGGVATIIACLNLKDLIEVLKFAFSLRAAGPFFPFILGHYWKRGSNAGALFSIIGGTAMMAVMTPFRIRPLGMDPVIPAIGAALALYLVGSLVWPDATRKPDPFVR